MAASSSWVYWLVNSFSISDRKSIIKMGEKMRDVHTSLSIHVRSFLEQFCIVSVKLPESSEDLDGHNQCATSGRKG